MPLGDVSLETISTLIEPILKHMREAAKSEESWSAPRERKEWVPERPATAHFVKTP